MSLPTFRNPFPRRLYRGSADSGSGMIVTIMIMALVVALGATATSLAIGNLRGSTSAQQAGTALDSAEAGIAQATTYIRTYGTRKLRCNLTTCTTNPWSPTNPVSAQVAGGGRWEAYIEPIPPNTASVPGRFKIRSAGTAGGPAQRVLETEVTVAPIDLPKAVFGRTINLVGTVDIQNMSVFSTGCVYKRDHLDINTAAGLDLAYGVPAGVHSSQIITESNGSGQYCPNTAKPVHKGLTGLLGGLTSLLACNDDYPFDQDKFGGSLTSGLLPALLAPCAPATSNPAYQQHDYDLDGSWDVNGSFIKDDRALFKSFGIKRPALTAAEIEQLRVTAQAQGNYYESTGGWAVPTNPHSVLFFDLNGGTVDLNPLSTSPLFSRLKLDATNPLCLDASLAGRDHGRRRETGQQHPDRRLALPRLGCAVRQAAEGERHVQPHRHDVRGHAGPYWQPQRRRSTPATSRTPRRPCSP